MNTTIYSLSLQDMEKEEMRCKKYAMLLVDVQQCQDMEETHAANKSSRSMQLSYIRVGNKQQSGVIPSHPPSFSPYVDSSSSLQIFASFLIDIESRVKEKKTPGQRSDNSNRAKAEMANKWEIDETDNGKAEDMILSRQMKEFSVRLKDFFHSSEYSDLVIETSDNQVFKVHKLVICGQSEVFAGMFNREWKESTTNTIKLHDDDPRVVEAMIHFLYGIDYDDSGSSSNSSSSEDSSQSSPLFNVKVYGIADKYGIETLQLRAQEKFAAAIRTGWKQDEFAHAIVEAYTKTSAATDKKSILRKVIVEVAKEHIESLMEMDEFVNALEDVGGFGADLIHALVGGTTNSGRAGRGRRGGGPPRKYVLSSLGIDQVGIRAKAQSET
ncbi:BTB/POZ domain-containing protein [Rasamsonia emersonii CBS 393.64]|uniref:BTB/POZ domain-containing protein n=1 Tax=Rasamsonia emersonii (strain ATCC 16479 / CBS 393.64 / IMI 116815) TaxID=1408163 RepID=A0A0F4Z281_RASE3|nr:BTB/POZ domain-containing protein [Rasamsonia emersonii CBS 393.64]KKA23988.1 BTB/POZ domain-containing protein [Rasamsonia emersonii CBS 393.64]